MTGTLFIFEEHGIDEHLMTGHKGNEAKPRGNKTVSRASHIKCLLFHYTSRFLTPNVFLVLTPFTLYSVAE